MHSLHLKGQLELTYTARWLKLNSNVVYCINYYNVKDTVWSTLPSSGQAYYACILCVQCDGYLRALQLVQAQ